jgi:predicted ATPase/Tfp pilus assembly protein PilF
VAGQRALAGHPWPEEVEMLRVRMVLHTGDVELQDGDYHGLVLHRAARMLAAAHGGQILCSEATAAVLRRDLALGVRLGDLGVYRLRDVAMPERLFQVEYPDMPRRQFPPLHAEAGYAANLPLQLTRFFGREEELACLGEMLTPAPMVDVQWLMVNDRREVPSSTINHQSSTIGPARLVTLMGSGGSGKTRLALEVAARLVERFHGAVWFVPLADRVDARSIADAVLDTLRLPRSPHVEPLEQLVEALTRQPSLLLLDNFEQLVGEGAAIVRTMLERVATLQCLVTSRQALGLAGEREFVVAPLPTPGGAHIPEQLTLCESVQLFVDRAQAVRPDFQVTNANANAVAELCNRLEGIPLALELAAARSQVLTPAQILTHLEHRLDLLVSRRRDTAARQRSLRATIDWSYRLLPSELQQFFARLSVFRGGWTLEAAEEVCAEPLSLDYLAQLRECSLVEVEEARRAGGPDRPCRAAEGAEMRFRMLETLREYAAEQRTPEDRAALERRHLEHYLALAEEAEPGLAGPEEAGTHVVGGWLERLAAEYENVRAALRWGAEREPVLALRLAGALGQFWEVRGLWAEGRAALDQVSERAETAPPEFQIKASHWAGTLAWRQGEYEPARELLQRSLDLARAAGDPHGIVKALLGLGNVASDQGDDTLARALYAESLAVGRETGDSDEEAPGAGIAAALNGLGCIALDYRGDYPAARALFEESLAIRRQIGDRWAIAGSLNNLGLVALHQGDYPAAQAFHEEGLRLRREIGDRRGMALSLNNLGCIASNQGDHATARALYEQSLAIGREIGDPWAIAGSLNNLGEVAQAQGDDQSAGAFFMDALLVNRRLGNRSWQAISLDNLGELASARDETEAARAFYRESLELRRQIEERSGIAASLERFACLAAGQQQAEPHSPEGHASGLRALRLFGAAEALRAASGASLPPNKQGERDAHLATLRQHLGDTAFTAAWEVGSALTWQAAAAEALE